MKKLVLGLMLTAGLFAGCGDDKGSGGSGGGAGSGGSAGGSAGSGGGSTGCDACTKLLNCCKATGATTCDMSYMPLQTACANPQTAATAQSACAMALQQLQANPNAPAACK